MPDTHRPQNTRQTNGQAGAVAAAAARAETHAADDAARRSAEAVMQRGRAAGEAPRQGAHATADTTRQGTQASVEAMRRAGETANETVRRTAQAVAEGQRQIAQEAAQTFQEVSRQVAQAAQGTSQEVRRLATLPQAAEGGLRDLQQSMAGLVEGVVQANLRAAQELFRLVNPAPVVELQRRLAREYLDTVMRGTATLVRAVRRTADETLRPLEAQVEQRQQAHRSYHAAAE